MIPDRSANAAVVSIELINGPLENMESAGNSKNIMMRLLPNILEIANV